MRDRLIALALCVATALALALTERDVGFPRDEGTYFDAARSYALWYEEGWASFKKGDFTAPFSDAAISKRFETNHEHPVLMKTAFGLSHALFTKKLGWLRDAAGFRLPAFLVSGLLSALLYLFGARWISRGAGLFAVGAFWLAPRHFFHGHLAAFDMPIAAAWMLVVWCYWRSLERPRWAVATGVAFGLALATKHNAWILPGVLLLHWALATPKRPLLRSLAPFIAMATLGPLIFFLHWPWLWHHPLERLAFYIGFHTDHLNYPWEYFGRLLVEAPFPPFYAFGLTAVTFPVVTLLLATLGSLGAIAQCSRTWLGRRDADGHSTRLLVLGNAFASLAVFSLPSTPIFGGMKHWLPSMVFLCLLAALAFQRIARDLGGPRRWVPALLGLLALTPSAIALVRNHPYGTSAYNEIAGGEAGAASLGMHRQYWSQNVTGIFPWLNAHAPQGARVFFHEVTWTAYDMYLRSGMLRPDLRFAGSIHDSDLAAYQYMPEFRDTEFQIWNTYGTRTPVAGLYLEETPQIVLYARPGVLHTTPQPSHRFIHNP